MGKRYLSVPFEEKDEAKKLGAKWDISVKKWYIPDNINVDDFARWLIKDNDYKKLKVISDKYYIVSGQHTCWKCKKETKVWSLQLYKENKKPSYNSFIYYINDLLDDVLSEINRHTKYYKKDYSKTLNGYYYMNHCEHCSMKIGDFGLYEEPDGGFCVTCSEDKKFIKFHLVNSPFAYSRII
jgi:hypothetical protein